MQTQQKTRLQAALPAMLAACVAGTALSGCSEAMKSHKSGENGDPDDPNGECVSNREFFETNIQPILAKNCASCHTVSGEAKGTEFLLETVGAPDYLERNIAVFEKMSKLRFEDQPWIILKPTGAMDHRGGVRFAADSDEQKVFSEMIGRLDAPVACDDDDDVVAQFFDGVEMLDEVATLRKATLLLVGRVPTEDEIAAVRKDGMDGLDKVLKNAMHEEAFYGRVRDVFNDQFLTRRYHSSNPNSAIDLLSRSDYPNADVWDDSEIENAYAYANDAIAEEPLRLLEHILRNDLPYTEMLTADYTVVNPYSAKVYGVQPTFEDESDPNEFVATKIPGIPHAGVPTMVSYLARWTTTRTNRNRARSRRFQKFFLATDVLELGTRPTDASGSKYDNPTLDDANCVTCHSAVDPVAATFANFDEMGRHRPPGHPLRGENVDDPELLDVPETGWYPDMRPAGYKGTPMPSEWESAGLQWLAQQVSKDPLFAMGPVEIVYTSLFGREPLSEPKDPDAPGFVEGVRAAKAQRQVLQDIATKFADGNYDLRIVFAELVKSPFFRAVNAKADLSAERALELADVGIARWLTPEELNAKIMSTTGVVWGPLENPSLLDRSQFLILYGGINSDDVVERSYDASGTSANIARRMANEVACVAVPLDFARPAGERLLFADTTVLDGPLSDAVRDTIVHLHWHLLGESLEPSDPEIDRTFQLWVDVYEEGQRGLTAGEYTPALPGPCVAMNDPLTGDPLETPLAMDDNYAIRSWIAVTSYLLTDYRFLHE